VPSLTYLAKVEMWDAKQLAMTKQIQNEKLAAEITSDPRWQSIVARDKESDGKFFYSVKNTGVYCRPSCGARLARPECKRCKSAGLSLIEAKAIGMPNAVRAVAQTCGANTLAVAIPCHRVIRNRGALSGYRWGVERKRALLDREAQA